jgi:hypothetical protein
MFAPITKVNEGESNTPCPSTLEDTPRLKNYLMPCHSLESSSGAPSDCTISFLIHAFFGGDFIF